MTNQLTARIKQVKKLIKKYQAELKQLEELDNKRRY